MKLACRALRISTFLAALASVSAAQQNVWTSHGPTKEGQWIGALAVDPEQPSTIWAGGISSNYPSGPGLFRSADSGLSWTTVSGPPGATALAIHPDDSRTLYAGWSWIFRTENGGETWRSSHPNLAAQLTSLAIDPNDPRRVWAGTGPGRIGRPSQTSPYEETGAGLFLSDDGAGTWRPASIAQSVYSILFDERHPGTLYAGSYDDIGLSYGYYGSPIAKGGSIFVSYSSGATFTKGTRFEDPVLAMAADPFADAVYLAAGNRVFRSVDRGATWVGLGTSSGTIRQLVADPVRPGRFYCSNDHGVLQSNDRALSWHSFSSGLPPDPAGPLAISPDGRWLYAGTRRGGVFQVDLDDGTLPPPPPPPPPPSPCVPGDTRLCLVGGRYAVDLVAARRGKSSFQPGAARPLGDRAGYFGLPSITDDPQLPEVIVKMLGDGAFGHPGAPVFYSSLTTVSYRLTVTDTMTGQETVYVNNPDQPLCGQADLLLEESEALSSLRTAGAPVAEESTLHLLGGRFSVSLEARHARSGKTGSGVVVSSGDVYGIFSLPAVTGDATFPEVAVKMVDARSFTGKFWLFHTSLTSLDYTLTVTDSLTGAVQTYRSTTPFCGAADTSAFTDAPPSDPPLDLNGEWTGTLTYGSYFRTYNSCSAESIRMRIDHREDGKIFGRVDPGCAPTVFIDGTVGAEPGAAGHLTVRLWVGLDLLGHLSGTVTSTAIKLDSIPRTEVTSLFLAR